MASKTRMPTETEALRGRDAPAFAIPETHFVNGARIQPPFPEGSAQAMFGMGCFWGAERRFWQTEGVISTAVGYAAGVTPHPTYREVCTGMTGHNEVVLVIFDPAKTTYEALLRVFFESHNPTQGMRQGNDVGTQYRSGVYAFDSAQREAAEAMRAAYDAELQAAGQGAITTEVLDAPTFYYAEADHQQYLGKNPNGYCGLGGCGIKVPAQA